MKSESLNTLQLKYTYYIFSTSLDKEFYIGKRPDILKGISLNGKQELQESFPSDVCFTFKLYGNSKDVVGKFYKQLEKGKILTDFIDNTHNLLIVSERIRSLFKENKVKDVEFLPVKLRAVDDKIIADNYYIIHCLGRQDIVDREKTKYEPCNINPANIMFVDGLVLKYDTLDAEAQFFKVAGIPSIFMIRQDLLDILTTSQKKKIKGYYIADAEGFTASV